MKKLIAIAALSTLFTGHAMASDEPSLGSRIRCGYGICSEEVRAWSNSKLFNNAKQDCQQIGHNEGTPAFTQCVQTLVENERTRRAAQAVASQPVQCQRVGSMVQCY